MKRMIMIATLAVSLVGFAGLASANENFRGAAGVDAREWRQEGRIHAGVRGGDLTRREAGRLQNGQRRIHRFENRARFDGRMSFRERGRLMRMQNVQSARIWRMRHNGRCS